MWQAYRAVRFSSGVSPSTAKSRALFEASVAPGPE